MELRGLGAGRPPAGDEVAGGVLGFTALLVGGLVADFDQLTGFREVGGLGVSDHRAQVPLFAAAVSAVGFGERGGAWASCC